MSANGQTIIQIFEQLAPKYLALPDDKIGLQVGTLNKAVNKVLLTLDVLENVVDEAIEKGVDLIIAHHPLIFKPLKNIRTDMPQGYLLEKLIKNDISVYVAHTNLDVAVNGVNDVLAEKIGLENIVNLDTNYIDEFEKLVVFVPVSHQNIVLDTLTKSGAGHIGKYSDCTFTTSGIGTFKPLEETKPFIGKIGSIEKVEEVRIETIIPKQKQRQIIQSMKKVHPYEEVAYDLYPLDMEGTKYGLGRKGVISEKEKLSNFVELIKIKLEVDGVRVVGDLDKIVKKVAIVGGDGDSYIRKAIYSGVDVLVTGDVYYHTAHEAMANDMAVIDVGHYIEKHVMINVKKYLENKFIEKKLNVDLIISEENTNPFKFL